MRSISRTFNKRLNNYFNRRLVDNDHFSRYYYNQEEPNSPYPKQHPRGSMPQQTGTNGLAKASQILGILGIVLCYTIFGGFIGGSLAIVFGLISRGGQKQPSGAAKVGIITGTIALVITAALMIWAVYFIFANYGGFNAYLDYFYSNGVTSL